MERKSVSGSGRENKFKAVPNVNVSVQPRMVTLCLCLLTAGNCLEYANNHQGGNHSPRTQDSPVVDNHQAMSAYQDQASDGESHMQTQMPMQGFSPLHIPQFSGSMNVGYSSGAGVSLATGQSAGVSTCSLTRSQKARGSSDSPGVCPLCGATLRQARNLRRHLLSSCKFRFSNNLAQTIGNDPSMMIGIKTEVEIPGYNDQTTRESADSGGSNNSCEQIVCKPSLLSPTTQSMHDSVSPQRSISSPTMAR